MATTAYDRPFVSCEDSLPRVAGAFNFVCTVSSIAIMVVPLQLCGRFMKQSYLEAKVYFVFLFLTFVWNLMEHATGVLGPPCIESIGCCSNLWLTALLLRIQGWETIVNEVRMVATLLSILSIMIGFWSIHAEIKAYYSIATPLVIYILSTMGRLSYDNPVAWRYYTWSLIPALTMAVSLPLEPSWCNLWDTDNRARAFYHGIYIHTLATVFLRNVASCVLELVDKAEKQRECIKKQL
ncbi:expressed unknown protein [Seminavis robusta]|uniref:Uncharacterized protein n=1 Tax=Seminavis robusta TaxID=568900 RepID=A0A9N8F436_9STRA|nr:expressed unknown protein [Seminavis robusta]|eukprot:Sro3387_g347480.1 n/a (238) ;mRNA; f:324-1037